MSWDNLKLSTGKKTLDHVHSNDHPSSQKTLLEWDHPLTTERETWRIEGSTAHNDSNACTWCIWKPWPTIEVIRMRPERTTQDFLIWMDVLQVCTAMGLWCAKWTKKFQEPRDSRSLACETRFFSYMKLGPGDCSLAHYALEWPWNWAWNEATVIYSSYSKLIRIQWRSHKSVCCEWLNDLKYIYTICCFSCRSRFGSNLWATVATICCAATQLTSSKWWRPSSSVWCYCAPHVSCDHPRGSSVDGRSIPSQNWQFSSGKNHDYPC